MLVRSQVKYIQSLGQKEHRDQEGKFIAEGPKLIAELIDHKKIKTDHLFAVESWINSNKKIADSQKTTIVSESELVRISSMRTPNQVLGIFEKPLFDEEIITKGKITLILDTIQDPGNLGTIIRIADWFGVENIICTPDSADNFSSRVVQASMGSIARVNCIYINPIKWLTRNKGIKVYAAMLNGTDITTMEKIKEGIIVIGNESKGISEELQEYVDEKFTIPKFGNAESLNAAVAAGIILYQMRS